VKKNRKRTRCAGEARPGLQKKVATTKRGNQKDRKNVISNAKKISASRREFEEKTTFRFNATGVFCPGVEKQLKKKIAQELRRGIQRKEQ